MRIAPLIILCLVTSCSSISRKLSSPFPKEKVTTNLKLSDKSGEFKIVKESKYNPKKREVMIRHTVFDSSDLSKKVLEKSISVSNYGILGKSVPVLRPKISQYFVWFDGKKFATEMKINKETQSLDIKLRSPEPQWHGNKSIPFPKGSGVYCFFSQVEECVGVTGFIKKAIKKKTGSMNLHIIWDGYPYFMDQYLTIRPRVFAEAVFRYDGKKGVSHRFALEVDDQVIFYIYDNMLSLKKILWVSQGYSRTLGK